MMQLSPILAESHAARKFQVKKVGLRAKAASSKVG